ncbi:MAG: hypothetical protein FWB71_06110 [Defluviitaleaceae bacterium]|nr:hypothetical protein [Defluviitaleaceae bacterium]
MAQIQALQGYFRNGQFVSEQAIKIPENVEVFITITGREIPLEHMEKGLTAEQLDKAKGVLSAINKITEKGLSAETLEAFETLERGDFKFKIGERLP